MSGAAGALQAAALAALEAAEPIGGAYPGKPLQAALPYATVECGPERDWSHKSGRGRELRLAVTVHASGERPERAQALADAAEAAIAAGLAPAGWQLATLGFVRRMTAVGRGGEAGWSVLIEYRARMLQAQA